MASLRNLRPRLSKLYKKMICRRHLKQLKMRLLICILKILCFRKNNGTLYVSFEESPSKAQSHSFCLFREHAVD